MLRGQTAEKDGYQIALFPMDYLNCTQVSGPDSYSHCCGHPCDWVGPSARYPYYAPCDCHLIYSDASGNTRGYQSDAEVWTPMGLQYICFSFTHDNTPPDQYSFRQGDLIGHTGTAGFATGDHMHLDQAAGAGNTLISYGITCSAGNLCYALRNSTEVTQIFYITGDEAIINTQGMEFENAENVKDPSIPAWMMAGIIRKRRLLGYGQKRKHPRVLRPNK